MGIDCCDGSWFGLCCICNVNLNWAKIQLHNFPIGIIHTSTTVKTEFYKLSFREMQKPVRIRQAFGLPIRKKLDSPP